MSTEITALATECHEHLRLSQRDYSRAAAYPINIFSAEAEGVDANEVAVGLSNHGAVIDCDAASFWFCLPVILDTVSRCLGFSTIC